MQQIIIDFGTVKLLGLSFPLRVYGYGLMLVLGFLSGIYLARRRARRVGEDPDVLTHCGLLALIGGIVGARAAFVIEQREFYADASPAEIFNVTSGGLIYYGGLLLATAAVLAYLWLKRLPARRHLDILAVSIMVGLAFGRAGCTLNGCCFGGRCSDDWALGMRFPMYSKPLLKFDGRENPYSSGMHAPSPLFEHQRQMPGELEVDPLLLDSAGRLIPPRDFTARQIEIAEASWSNPVKPAQPLGLVNALVIAAVLGGFYRLRKREGQVFALMLILYPITRFVLELIRHDNPHQLLAGVLTHNQYTSLAMFAVGVVLWLVLRRLPASAGPTRSERAKRKVKPGR
ncbi:MAG: prolipoprotein diacylglyceryl transferase [Planctomycetota bacterium]|nr:prolipoprotein diacylglyceryl transferase [Planctomycetota bacterium]